MIEIGTDLENIERFKLDKNSSFVKNNFTPNEIVHAFSKDSPHITLCGLFCAKEAIIKTLSKQDILLNEIEINREDSGKPIVKIIKKDFSQKSNFSVSISHSGEYAFAVALRTKND